jgi:Ca-activated chloride channel family protein
MLARDYDGDTERLTAVKKDCGHIIEELDGAKFAVISFNNNANLVAPFTNNSQYAEDVIDSLYPLEQLYAEGTSMNVSIDVMTYTLKRAREKADGSVVVFFISDGEITNEENLKSFKSAAKYVDGGAVLGYGTTEGGNMYMKSSYTGQDELIEDTSSYPRKPAVSVIDEDNLKSIADDMDVKYINMNDASNIDTTINKIKRESASERKDGKVSGYADIYYIFAAMLVLVMIWEFIDIRRKSGELAWRKEQI